MSGIASVQPLRRKWAASGYQFRPLLCMCVRYSADDGAHWGPCPPSLCQRKSHTLVHRVATSGRDYRYGGFRAWLRWVVRGISADAEEC